MLFSNDNAQFAKIPALGNVTPLKLAQSVQRENIFFVLRFQIERISISQKLNPNTIFATVNNDFQRRFKNNRVIFDSSR